MIVDWAYGRPTPAALKAAGVTGVVRYLSRVGQAKRLTPEETSAYRAAGLDVHVVYEDSAGRCLAGREAGRDDARTARAQARALGWDGRTGCIYTAADMQIITEMMPRVLDYAAGWLDELPAENVGVYGQASVCDAVRDRVGYLWQTAAWSAGRKVDCAFYQNGRQRRVDETAVDLNDVLTPGRTGAIFRRDDVVNDADIDRFRQAVSDLLDVRDFRIQREAFWVGPGEDPVRQGNVPRIWSATYRKTGHLEAMLAQVLRGLSAASPQAQAAIAIPDGPPDAETVLAAVTECTDPAMLGDVIQVATRRLGELVNAARGEP